MSVTRLNQKHFALTIAALGAALMFVRPVHAEQREQCDPATFVSTENAHWSHTDSLAYLNLVDRSNWSEASKNISAGVTLPIEVPIDAQASYDSFSVWWEHYKQQTHYVRNVTDDLAIVSSLVHDNDLQKYRACLSGMEGLSTYVRLNGTHATLTLGFHPAPPLPGQTVPRKVPVTLTTTNGTDSARVKRTSIAINGSAEYVFTVTPGRPFSAVAEIEGVSAADVHVLVPKIYTCTITTEPKTLTTTKIVDASNNAGEIEMRGFGKVWKADLEKEGHKNVTVWLANNAEENHKHRFGGGYYRYVGYYAAHVDGYTEYGADPRCKRDEPAPVTETLTTASSK